MSSAILNAQASSAVVATVNSSSGLVEPFVYQETGRLTSPGAVQLLNVPSDNAAVTAGRSHSFSIPKNGLLTGIWLELDMPSHADTASDPATTGDVATNAQTEDSAGTLTLATRDTQGFGAAGLYGLIASARIETSGRVIEELDLQSILAKVSDLSYGERRSVEQAACMGSDARYGGTYKKCIWLPFYFNAAHPGGGDPRYAWNSLFNEPLRCVITLSDCKVLYHAATLTTGMTKTEPNTMDLLCKYHVPSDAAMDAIVNKNYGSGMLSQLVSVMRPEADYSFDGPANAGTVTSTVDLKTNEAIEAIYFSATRDEDAFTAGYANALKNRAPLEIDTVELKFNNSSVFACPGEWCKHFGRVGGHGDGTDASFGNSMQYVYKLDFATIRGTGTTGIIATRELSNPQLVVGVRCAGGDKKHKIHVRYSTKAFLTTNANSGRVSLSISS